MKKAISTLLFTFVLIGVMAETVERGSVKEYRGTEDKTALSGVELQVKGAQSTISDADGSFELHFATLKPGEKVSYTDIYKDGYVIFNKDALDAWRISNNGRPFTIVMCREADFRALKKKFYGIIEKSYYQEYLRQRELAAKTALTAQQLESRLREVENDYNEKMSNINNYVELFSRIDRNEMDSVEAKALAFMENGQIDEAIKTYEELQLRKEMDFQFSKWDAADEMRRAANGMESEAQADLLALVDKMQKQISLYQMGGSEYDVKRFEMMGNLISLLYRLRPITEGVYNETLGKLIVEKANCTKSSDRISAYREAAALPSVAGLRELARCYQIMPPSEARTDSIKDMYRQALSLMTADNDSLMVSLQAEMKQIPDGYYHHSDGKSYPYRLLPDNKAVLTGQGPWFATHLEGTVELPSFIVAAGRADTVVGLDEFAFGRNRKLYKVTLPQHCRYIGTDAFKGCDSLTLVVNPELEVVHSTKVSETIPADAIILIPKIRINVKNVSKLVRDYIAAEKLLPKPSDDHIFDRNLKSDRIGRMLQNAIRQDNNFSRYADLVCRVAKVEYKELPQWDNFRVVDYEELVSIGILAVQVLIKNKTPEQLANYNDLYIATAVTWAIQNELKIRYEWYEYLLGEYLVDVLSYDLAKQYGTAGIDYQIGQVRLACYKVLAQVGSTYGELSDSVAEGGSGAGESELQKMWRLVKGCRDKMPGKYLECYDAFFTPDADYINIQYRYSPVIIQGMFNEIKAILNDAGMHGF